ncbi:MAG: metalloregulator ArsR/SmtB family transcription factor [Tepidiforma sp.]|jgi:ArsR family transcriptional regulator|uniref:ArsR/SmtB family transcription factor n=1 Tax=Tepidiforma sp. TaxID=2682230 RepID=UPI0021DC2DF4|nr:metalloregulator ArsR/SmtB family transcription factor [Tepidiforma sp.]MCX7617076.1 metalloregulator ArsR/SmtB family transcription factor [Tepidiforma sp.]GIW18175.1 MAG: transcriptional regulator [Tepidiforma sp.]
MAEMVPPHLLEPVAERFRILGDATRLAILRTLMLEGELNVSQLVDRLEMSQANISKHLKILADAGIVARRAEGTAAFYRVTDPTLTTLCDLVCGRLREQAEAEARAFSTTR